MPVSISRVNLGIGVALFEKGKWKGLVFPNPVMGEGARRWYGLFETADNFKWIIGPFISQEEAQDKTAEAIMKNWKWERWSTYLGTDPWG